METLLQTPSLPASDSYQPPTALMFLNETDWHMYNVGNPFTLATNWLWRDPANIIRSALNSEHLVANKNFSVYADVAGKPGLIGNNVGDGFKLMFRPNIVQTHFINGVIKMNYLTSYENMGTMEVVVSSVHPAKFRNESDHRHIHTEVIDSLCSELVSITQTRILKLLPQDVALLRASSMCLMIRVRILSSEPERKGNKVKIAGFVLY
jgi:hypothetical protein